MSSSPSLHGRRGASNSEHGGQGLITRLPAYCTWHRPPPTPNTPHSHQHAGLVGERVAWTCPPREGTTVGHVNTMAGPWPGPAPFGPAPAPTMRWLLMATGMGPLVQVVLIHLVVSTQHSGWALLRVRPHASRPSLFTQPGQSYEGNFPATRPSFRDSHGSRVRWRDGRTLPFGQKTSWLPTPFPQTVGLSAGRPAGCMPCDTSCKNLTH